MREKTYCHFFGAQLSKKLWEGSLRLFCEQGKEPIYENPVPATCTVVVDDKKRVLLVKRNMDPKKGFWCLPGGFMELGETPEQGALRELKEETGLTGRIDMLLGTTSNQSTLYHTVLIIGYLVQAVAGTLQAGDDASEVSYFGQDELPEIAFESHKNFIRIYFAAYAVSTAMAS